MSFATHLNQLAERVAAQLSATTITVEGEDLAAALNTSTLGYDGGVGGSMTVRAHVQHLGVSRRDPNSDAMVERRIYTVRIGDTPDAGTIFRPPRGSTLADAADAAPDDADHTVVAAELRLNGTQLRLVTERDA